MFYSQLQQSEDVREAEMTDLHALTDEFTNRLSDAEKKMQVLYKVNRKKYSSSLMLLSQN